MSHRDVEAQETAGLPPTTRRFVQLLQRLEGAQDAETEWRKLERQWLGEVLHRPVVAFDDAQIVAELLARHCWESAGSGTPRGRAAFVRLQELRKRRGVDALACWQSMSDDKAS